MDYQVQIVDQNYGKQIVVRPPAWVEIQKDLVPIVNAQPYLFTVKSSGWLKELQFSYDIGQLPSLQQFFQQYSVDKQTVLHILEGIIRPLLAAKSARLTPDDFMLDLNYIFYDLANAEIRLIYLPFESGGQAGLSVMYIIARIFGECLTPLAGENTDYIQRIMTFYNDPKFNARDLLTLLQELKTPGQRKMMLPQLKDREPFVVPQPVAAELLEELVVTSHRHHSHPGRPVQLDDLDKTVMVIPGKRKSMLLSVSIKGMMNEMEIHNFPCVLGRSTRGANIFFEDASVSRKHATLDCLRGIFTVVDNYSSNGISLNGIKLPPGVPRPVSRGDLLKLGMVEIEIVDLVGA